MYQIESPATFPINEHSSSEFYGTFHRYMSSALQCMGREDVAVVYFIKLVVTARLHKAKVDWMDLWILVSSWQKLGIPGLTVACVPEARDILAEALRRQQAD